MLIVDVAVVEDDLHATPKGSEVEEGSYDAWTSKWRGLDGRKRGEEAMGRSRAAQVRRWKGRAAALGIQKKV